MFQTSGCAEYLKQKKGLFSRWGNPGGNHISIILLMSMNYEVSIHVG